MRDEYLLPPLVLRVSLRNLRVDPIFLSAPVLLGGPLKKCFAGSRDVFIVFYRLPDKNFFLSSSFCFTEDHAKEVKVEYETIVLN